MRLNTQRRIYSSKLDLKNDDLKRLSSRMGLATYGTKLELKDRYVTSAQYRIQSHILAVKSAPAVKSVVAIDIGYKNLGYVHLHNSKPFKILHWELINPEISTDKYDVQGYAKAVSLLIPRFRRFGADYVMERQHVRPTGVFGRIPHTAIRNLAFEAMVYRCVTIDYVNAYYY